MENQENGKPLPQSYEADRLYGLAHALSTVCRAERIAVQSSAQTTIVHIHKTHSQNFLKIERLRLLNKIEESLEKLSKFEVEDTDKRDLGWNRADCLAQENPKWWRKHKNYIEDVERFRDWQRKEAEKERIAKEREECRKLGIPSNRPDEPINAGQDLKMPDGPPFRDKQDPSEL